MDFIRTGRITEANIVAEFYHQCRVAGITCYLEYVLDHCRLDAVIVQGEKIVAIVEVKSYSADRPINMDTKQFGKYLSFRVPIFWITRFSQIRRVVGEIQGYLAKVTPKVTTFGGRTDG